MTKIVFLGMGAMGTRMAQHLQEVGFDLTVWNRTSESCAPLVKAGADQAEHPGQAVQSADIVISMLRDDAASAAVWLGEHGALKAMLRGSIVVECSTLSLPCVARLSDAARRRGLQFADAPVVGSRPQAEAGGLIFLTGGAEETLATLSPVLAPMAAKVHHVGGVGAGMALKLMVNALFGTQLALAAELLGFAQRTDMPVPVLAKILAETPVCSPALKLALPAMLSGQFPAAFPIDLVEKDFGLVSASAPTAALPVVQTVRQVFEDATVAGYGGDNITGIVQQYLEIEELVAG